MTSNESVALIAQLETMLAKRRERRAQQMPTEAEALAQFHNAYERLQDLGWLPAVRAPNDGTPFRGIMLGARSPMVFVRFGDFSYLRDDYRLYAGEPCLFKFGDLEALEHG